MNEVQPAINDLLKRRRAIMEEIEETELGQALTKIDAALAALGAEVPKAPPRRAIRRRRKPSNGSVRFKAQALLDEANKCWDYDAILAEYDSRGESIIASDPKAALRTALWAMVQAEDARRCGDGVFRSAKFDDEPLPGQVRLVAES